MDGGRETRWTANGSVGKVEAMKQEVRTTLLWDEPKDITTIADLSKLVETRDLQDDVYNTVLYRGHGAKSFKLLPKVARCLPPEKLHSKTVNEPLMLELFRRQSVDRIAIADADDWELLAIAQHHGLATRLLDWTRSPLVALYFAVRNEIETRDINGCPKKEDAEIIVWRCPKIDLTELTKKLANSNPLEIANTVKYIPRIVTPRLRAQQGVFTVHPQSAHKFQETQGFQVFQPTGSEGSLGIIRIPNDTNDIRKKLKYSLFRHGINESVLFPDIDGLARHIQWCQTKSY